MTSETPTPATPSARAQAIAQAVHDHVVTARWREAVDIGILAGIIDAAMAEPAVVPALREALEQVATHWLSRATEMDKLGSAPSKGYAKGMKNCAGALREALAQLVNTAPPPSPAPQGERPIGTCHASDNYDYERHKGLHEPNAYCERWTPSPPAAPGKESK